MLDSCAFFSRTPSGVIWTYLSVSDFADIENLVRAPRKIQKEGRARPGSEKTKKTWFDGTKVSRRSFLRSTGLFSPLRHIAHGLSLIHCFNLFRGVRHNTLESKAWFCVVLFSFSNRHHGPREIPLYLCLLFILVQYYPHLILTCGG